MRAETQRIINDINELYGNTDLTPEETLAEMEEIQAVVDQNVDAVRDDIKNHDD